MFSVNMPTLFLFGHNYDSLTISIHEVTIAGKINMWISFRCDHYTSNSTPRYIANAKKGQNWILISMCTKHQTKCLILSATYRKLHSNFVL